MKWPTEQIISGTPVFLSLSTEGKKCAWGLFIKSAVLAHAKEECAERFEGKGLPSTFELFFCNVLIHFLRSQVLSISL